MSEAGETNAQDGSSKRKEERLQKELADCVLDSSWFWCLVGVALAVPIGVKTKSHLPLLYLGAGGTALDLFMGYSKCQQQRNALAELQQWLEMERDTK